MFWHNQATAQHHHWIHPYVSQIDSLFAANQHVSTPGVAVGILKEGQLIFSKGYGLANLEHGLPFTPNTVSDIGSVAKQITCFALVLLAQRGQLKLDDDIRKHLPEVPDFGQPITIRHLMNHTSGLREIYGMLELIGWKQGDAVRQEEALNLVQHSTELNFSSGSRYSYCNTAYMLLAEIIQKVGGKKFEDWMRDEIFRPLGMYDTYIMDMQGELFPLCADSYLRNEQDQWIKLYDNSTVLGAGGIYTTLPDLARWCNNYRDGKLGGMAAIRQMFQRGVLNSGDSLNYGLGLETLPYRGLRRIQHTGASAGYRAAMMYFPKADIVIMVKSNYANFNSQATCERIADIILAKNFTQGAPIAAINRGGRAKSAPSPPGELQEYVGQYYCPDVETTYTVQIEGDSLVGVHRYNGKFKIEHVDEDRFSGPSYLSTIQFERDKDGVIRGLRVSNGRVLNLWMKKL